ncbi:hypothetical protein DFO45_1731 [Azorhizobium sp. AG788]|uniref:DUF2946 family protein n=1 Tax=Azorhizobium sp. AG788 TaxID=2183897 RepID=UPI001060A522|nr:DUF2946 family protein [Azorhizobium sp. AG788]TDT96538.1 hypothetical protein DFO45_1731 [Azorhizobium sp. AG788]
MSFWRASRSGFGRWVFPLLLAYALLIQSVIGTLASTEHSVGVAAGFVCEGSAGMDHGPSDGAGHDALCCVFGCTAAAAPALLDPPAPFLLTERDTAVIRLAPLPDGAPARARLQLSFAARGPPARV